MNIINIHSFISEKITQFLDIVYYKNLQKLHPKEEELNTILIKNKFPILKPEYFIYAKYYFIYLFSYYLNQKSFDYSIPLHLIYISDIVLHNLIKKYDYTPSKNIYFLKDTANLIFYYLFNTKLFLSKKYLLLILTNIFVFGVNINHVYNKRLLSIENKTDTFLNPRNRISDYLKCFIVSSNKDNIQNIIHLTRHFTYSNYFLFINIMIYIFYYITIVFSSTF